SQETCPDRVHVLGRGVLGERLAGLDRRRRLAFPFMRSFRLPCSVRRGVGNVSEISLGSSGPEPPGRAVVLLAKSAFAAAPMQEMRRVAARMQRRRKRDHVVFAFSEQGTP